MPTYDRSIRSNGTKFAKTIEYRCELAVPYERSELFGNVWAHGIDEAREAFYVYVFVIPSQIPFQI